MADNIDGIIERIKKAVRLANKTTEAGERETAMRIAKSLAEKNGTLGFKLRRTDYMAGFFWKIHKKLEDHPLRNDISEASQKAEAAFKQYEQEQGKVKEHKQRGVKDDAASIYNGYMSADRVSLNRPCGNVAPKAGELQERRQIGRRV